MKRNVQLTSVASSGPGKKAGTGEYVCMRSGGVHGEEVISIECNAAVVELHGAIYRVRGATAGDEDANYAAIYPRWARSTRSTF